MDFEVKVNRSKSAGAFSQVYTILSSEHERYRKVEESTKTVYLGLSSRPHWFSAKGYYYGFAHTVQLRGTGAGCLSSFRSWVRLRQGRSGMYLPPAHLRTKIIVCRSVSPQPVIKSAILSLATDVGVTAN
jgi:hypothetical protein